MGLTRMDIKEVYSNVLLISIANKRNFYHLVKEAEEETKKYINNHKQESTGIYEVLPVCSLLNHWLAKWGAL